MDTVVEELLMAVTVMTVAMNTGTVVTTRLTSVETNLPQETT